MTELLEKPSQPLRNQLFDSYLIKTAEWLLGPDNSPYLLAQSGNSNWECALSTNYLLFIHHELATTQSGHVTLKEKIEQYLPQTTSWMASQVEEIILEGEEMAHWDEVTWDTAVCVRASLRTLDRFPEEFSSAQRDEIERTAKKALRWLAFKFNQWEESVIYSYGPADVAQILITACVVHERSSGLLAESINDYYEEPVQFIEDIVDYLLTYSEQVTLSYENEDESVAYWGDPFQSAEVIDSLTMYTSQVDKGLCPETDLTNECLEHVYECLMYIEYEQEEGKWGSHSDTCRTLYAYLRATTRVENIQPEHHITFKAVRWVCDEKQTFKDGSYLHTMFLTVFYALALQEAYENWPLAQQPSIEVLDQAMWSAPVRSSQERGRRLQLEVQHAELESRHTRMQNRFALSTGLAVFTFVIISSIFSAGFLGWVSLNNISITDLLTYYGALVIAIAFAATSVIYNYLSAEEKFRL